MTDTESCMKKDYLSRPGQWEEKMLFLRNGTRGLPPHGFACSFYTV